MSKKVSIEIGHGGADPGAARGDILEKDINLSVGLELKRQLERHSVNVLINRTTDVGFKVADFLARAKNFTPDAGISVHTNAFDGSAKGFEVFRNTNAFKTQSNLLCAGIEREVKALGQTSRGIKDSPFLMSSLACPTAYCELGFLDNSSDYSRFDTPEKQRAFGTAYAKGLLEFLSIPWQDEGGESAPTPPPGSAATAYTVAKGDTMTWIAKKLGVTLNALIAANPQVKNPDKINVGQVLNIPGGAGTTPPIPDKKSVEEVAQEIFRGIGDWGNDPERKQKLIAYGGEQFRNDVQARVNGLMKGE